MLTAVTLLTTAMSPITAGAAELSADEELTAYVKSLPVMEAVADQLDSGEIVQADAYEVEIGSEVDLKSDFTEISFNKEKIKVSFLKQKMRRGRHLLLLTQIPMRRFIMPSRSVAIRPISSVVRSL